MTDPRRFVHLVEVMELDLMVWIHLVLGVLCFVTAALALLSPKGGALHRAAGQTFSLAVLPTAGIAVWFAIEANHMALLLVGLLNLHTVISGYRVLYLKRSVPAHTLGPTRPGPLDKGMAQMTLLGSCAILAWAIFAWHVERLAPLMIVLGLGGAVMALSDLKRFRQPPKDPHHWITTHAIRMIIAATLAAVTITVLQIADQRVYVVWLAPLLLGLCLIGLWVRLISKRLTTYGDPDSFVEIRINDGAEKKETSSR